MEREKKKRAMIAGMVSMTSNAEIKIAAYKKIVTYDSIGNYMRENPINNYAREIHLMSMINI